MTRRTLIALGILALILGYIFSIDRNQLTTSEIERNLTRLLDLPKDSLHRIAFGDLVILKEGKTYRLQRPLQHLGEPEVLNPLFLQLERLSILHLITSPEADAVYGLAHPRLVVELRTEEKEWTLSIGNPVTDQGLDCYARIKGRDEVFVIKEECFNLLNKEPMEYALREPFAFITDGAAEVQWLNAGRQYTVLRRKGPIFQTGDQKRVWQADAEKAEGFLTLLEELDLSRYPHAVIDDEEAGLVDPAFRVEVYGDAGRAQGMWISPADPDEGTCWVKLEQEGLGFKVPQSIVEPFHLTFDRLAADELFDGAITRLRSVVFHWPDKQQSLSLQGEETTWQVVNHPYAYLMSSGRILNCLLRMAVTPLGDFQEVKLEKPFLVIQLSYDREDFGVEMLRLYEDPETPETWWVSRQDPTLARRITRPSFLEMVMDPFSLVDPKPFQTLLAKADRCEFKNTAPSFKATLDKDVLERWQVVEADGLASEEILEIFHSLNGASMYNAMEYQEGVDFGFKEPMASLEFWEADTRFMEMFMGSFSTLQHTFIRCNKDAILLFKNFPLLENAKELPAPSVMESKAPVPAPENSSFVEK